MVPPKSSPALPKLTIEEVEIVSNPIICTVPDPIIYTVPDPIICTVPDSPRRCICGPPTSPPEHIVDNIPEQVIEHVVDPEQVNEHVIDQVPDHVTQHVIDEDDEDEDEIDSAVFEDDEDEEECDFAVFEDDEDEEECDTDSIIGPKQQDQDDEDAAGQPTEADGSFDYSRRQSGPPFKQPPPVSNLMAPNALSVFGTSTVEPPHQIRQRMMTREFRHGLGKHVNWERRASMKTVRAFAERTRRLDRRNQTAEGGPKTGGDVAVDGDYLEGSSSNDLDKDEVWHHFDPLDYNARGW